MQWLFDSFRDIQPWHWLALGAILGAVVSPLAAIIPFITPGGAKDADCGALLAGAAAYGAPVRR